MSDWSIGNVDIDVVNSVKVPHFLKLKDAKKIMKTRKREYQKIVSTTNNVQRPQQASTNNNDVKLRQSIYSVQKVVMCSSNKTFTQSKK